MKHTPGRMIAVGAWVENFRDDKPDLVTSDGVGGDTDKERCTNAERIAALWNFAGKVSTEKILSLQPLSKILTQQNKDDLKRRINES